MAEEVNPSPSIPSPEEVAASIPPDASPEEINTFRNRVFERLVAPSKRYADFLNRDPVSAIKLKAAYLGESPASEFFPTFENLPPPARDIMGLLRPEVATPFLQSFQEHTTLQTPEQKQVAEAIMPPEQRGMGSAVAGMAGAGAAYAPALSAMGIGGKNLLAEKFVGLTRAIPEMLTVGLQTGLVEVQKERIRLQEQGVRAAEEEFLSGHNVGPDGETISKPAPRPSAFSQFLPGAAKGALLDAAFRGGLNYLASPFVKGIGKGSAQVARKFLSSAWKGRRSTMRDVLAGKIPPPEEVAELTNLMETGPAHLDPITEEVVGRVVKEPIIRHKHTTTGSVEITLRTGRKVFPKDLVKGYYKLPARSLEGKFMEGGPEIKFNWADVGLIEGPPEKITQLYKEMGLIGTEFKFAPAVKFMAAEAKARNRGYDLRQIGDKWFVFSNSRLVKEPTMRRALPEEEGPESVNKILDQFFGKAKGVEAREPVSGRRAVSEPQALEFGTKAEAEKWLDGQPYRESSIIESGFYEQIVDKKEGYNVLVIRKMVEEENRDNLRQLAEFFNGPTPPPTETLTLMPKDEFLPKELRSDGNVPSVVLGKIHTPPEKIALRLEEETKLPVWTGLYQPTKDAMYTHRIRMNPIRRDFPRVLKGTKKNGGRYFHALLTKGGTPEETLYAARNQIDLGKVEELRGFMREKFQEAKIGDADLFFQDYLPRILRAGSLKKAYPDPTMMPREVASLAHAINNDQIRIWADPDKMDLGNVLYSMVDRGSWHNEVEPILAPLRKAWDERLGDPNVPYQVKAFSKNFIDAVTGNTPVADRGVKIAMGRALKKISNTYKGDFDRQISPKEAQQALDTMFNTLFMLNYSANLGLRPAAVARQFMQTSQTTIPRFGYGYTLLAMQKRTTREGKRLIEESGVTVEPAFGLTDQGRLFGKVFASADAEQRRWAALAQELRFSDHIGAYVGSERSPRDWTLFARRSKVSRYDPIVQAEVKRRIDSGDVEGAKYLTMRKGAETTQFMYGAGDQPGWSRGIPGKFFGMYGTYASYFGEFMRTMFRDGDLVTERLPEISRWISTNALVATAFAEVFGADASGYLFFAPLKFGGGPLFNAAKDAYLWYGAFGAESEQAGERLTRTREIPLLNDFPIPNLALQFVPGQAAARDVMKLGEAKDLQDAARMLLTGFPELEGQEAEFPNYLLPRGVRSRVGK